MRTLLRKTSTGLFFEGPGKWTDNPDQAFNFKSIDRAITFIQTWKLHEIEVAFGFHGQPSVKPVPMERISLGYTED